MRRILPAVQGGAGGMADAVAVARAAVDAIAAKHRITKAVVDQWLKRDDGGFALESVEDFTYQ